MRPLTRQVDYYGVDTGNYFAYRNGEHRRRCCVKRIALKLPCKQNTYRYFDELFQNFGKGCRIHIRLALKVAAHDGNYGDEKDGRR